MIQVAEMVVVTKRDKQVGEEEEQRQIVGMIRGCIKTVTCGKKLSRNATKNANDSTKTLPVYTKLAYILGLRVSPSHRYVLILYFYYPNIYINEHY